MKILVVEDEERIANAIKKGLTQENFTVDVSYSGADGYDLAFSESYNVIILDLMLPGMDGLTICKNLRANGITTPILMLTAKSQLSDKVTGLDSGADDYLTKPFSFEELIARVRALTRRPRDLVTNEISVSDLVLNPTNYEVQRDGKEIQLSKKEFVLLEFMMRNANKILNKDQIITQAWSYESDILPNTVEVYIKNLRNKIDVPFKNKKQLIKTVRGFGYKLGD